MWIERDAPPETIEALLAAVDGSGHGVEEALMT
jgi:hypothetical protein